MTQYLNFVVVSAVQVSHNTKLLRLTYAQSQSHPHLTPACFPCGKHLSIRAPLGPDQTFVSRPYTPVSHPDSHEHLEILFKHYQGGKMSSHLSALNEGDLVELRGPFGRFKYQANKWPRIGMVAGGTGITPCLQVIRYVLESTAHRQLHPEDTTSFVLFYQNRTADDILLKQVLDALEEQHPERFTVQYFLTQPPRANWLSARHFAGYITSQDYLKFMSPDQCPLVAICGPSGFVEVSKNMLCEIGHHSKSIFEW